MDDWALENLITFDADSAELENEGVVGPDGNDEKDGFKGLYTRLISHWIRRHPRMSWLMNRQPCLYSTERDGLSFFHILSAFLLQSTITRPFGSFVLLEPHA